MRRSVLALLAYSAAFAAPVLPPGTWVNITPAAPQVDPDQHIFCQGMAIDPNHPSTLYLCVCGYDVSKPVGLYKTVDGGSTWKRVGNLDEPVHVAVDPEDSGHLYAVDGVRGNTLGFWVSRNGGDTWSKPDGFGKAAMAPVGTPDLYSLATEPGDFGHVLVSFHSPWAGSANAGVLESRDGGDSWTAHNPPAGTAGGYGMAVFFLDYPQLKQGNADTWLFTAQAGGFFRTTDAGKSWKQVYDLQMTHGGNQIYCAKNGTLYSGGYQYPARSTDNGATWAQVKTGLDYSWYIGIIGDGTNLYTAGVGPDRPVWTSPEADGQTWTAFGGGKQTFHGQPFEMAYDSTNGIVYSSNWEGLFALKVSKDGNAVRPQARTRASSRAPVEFDGTAMRVHAPGGRDYGLPGRRANSALTRGLQRN